MVEKNHYGTITINWQAAEEEESISSYLVQYRIQHNQKLGESWNTIIHSTNHNKITINDLQPDKTYAFRIGAKALGGKSLFGPISEITTEPVCPPPNDLQCSSVTDTSITVSWNHGGTNSERIVISSYLIECWKYGHRESALIQKSTTEKTIKFESLVLDTDYCIQVSAVCSENSGANLYSRACPILKIRTKCVMEFSSKPTGIAEKFKEEKYSQIVTESEPTVYKLKARNNTAIDNIHWLEIVPVDGIPLSSDIRNHKVIILMGATGCGKSTLINGMINYILGVQWNNSFRFKIIHEDESFTRNQAHIQTSTVTAYTVHHQEGMTIPYSITLIDTPGYGDPRGVQRDKEITQMIHQFLMKQETLVNQIHAVCFVATSGDCRLTVTQRYIFDSVLSIFGKDVKDNIRLLVTFADNAIPPVVKACSVAQFPVTSSSVGIVYSKFNNSVLYAPNRQGDSSFNELFWEVGRENFEKFFKMVEGMEGRDLTSTRQVIQCRQQQGKSLKNLERELENCFLKIEKMNKLREKRVKGMECKYSKIEIYDKEYCQNGFWAYNCLKCKQTCEKPIMNRDRPKAKKKKCRKASCSPCPPARHKFQNFEWSKRPVTVPSVSYMKCIEELETVKVKMISLLKQVDANTHSLDGIALRSNELNSADCLSSMRTRVTEKQLPGYVTRLEMLDELQRRLTADRQLATASNRNTDG